MALTPKPCAEAGVVETKPMVWIAGLSLLAKSLFFKEFFRKNLRALKRAPCLVF